MLAFSLEQDGHVVTAAEDGAVALSIARRKLFDLAIIDVNMPNMDGTTLIEEMRKLPGYESTPLLMLTSESAESIKQAGKQAGAGGWVVKPFGPGQLRDLVRRFLRQAGRNAPGGKLTPGLVPDRGENR